MAILQNLFGSRKKGYRVMMLAKNFAEYLFEPLQGNSGQVFFVKSLVGEVELLAKGFAVKEGLAVESEDVVGGGENGGEVVDESPRPVEDEIADQDKGLRG